jgi:hypothetical protein
MLWIQQAFQWVAVGDAVCVHRVRRCGHESPADTCDRALRMHTDDVVRNHRTVFDEPAMIDNDANVWQQATVRGSLCCHRCTSLSWFKDGAYPQQPPDDPSRHSIVIETDSMSSSYTPVCGHRSMNLCWSLSTMYRALQTNQIQTSETNTVAMRPMRVSRDHAVLYSVRPASGVNSMGKDASGVEMWRREGMLSPFLCMCCQQWFLPTASMNILTQNTVCCKDCEPARISSTAQRDKALNARFPSRHAAAVEQKLVTWGVQNGCGYLPPVSF